MKGIVQSLQECRDNKNFICLRVYGEGQDILILSSVVNIFVAAITGWVTHELDSEGENNVQDMLLYGSWDRHL